MCKRIRLHNINQLKTIETMKYKIEVTIWKKHNDGAQLGLDSVQSVLIQIIYSAQMSTNRPYNNI